jgi:Tfp pilus assembly protein FimV
MIDFEDSQAIKQIGTPVRKGVQAGAEDRVLVNAAGDRLLHQVLGEPRRHADPPAERQQVRPGKLGSQPHAEHQSLLSGEPESKIIVKDHRWWFVAVDASRYRRQHGSATGTPSDVGHDHESQRLVR